MVLSDTKRFILFFTPRTLALVAGLGFMACGSGGGGDQGHPPQQEPAAGSPEAPSPWVAGASRGQAGDLVVFRGGGFLGTRTVLFGPFAAVPESVSDSEIRVRIPADGGPSAPGALEAAQGEPRAQTGPLPTSPVVKTLLRTPHGDLSGPPFTLVPSLDQVPTIVHPGEQVTLHGTHLWSVREALIGTAKVPQVHSHPPQGLVMTIPADARSGFLALVADQETFQSTHHITVLPAPSPLPEPVPSPAPGAPDPWMPSPTHPYPVPTPAPSAPGPGMPSPTHPYPVPSPTPSAPGPGMPSPTRPYPGSSPAPGAPGPGMPAPTRPAPAPAPAPAAPSHGMPAPAAPGHGMPAPAPLPGAPPAGGDPAGPPLPPVDESGLRRFPGVRRVREAAEAAARDTGASPARVREEGDAAVQALLEEAAQVRIRAEGARRLAGGNPADVAAAGAMAEAGFLEASPAEALALGNLAREMVGTSGHAAAIQVRKQSDSPEGARAGHLRARARLETEMARNHVMAYGATSYDLTLEFSRTLNATDAFKALPLPPGHYRVNVDYLSADPYLEHHNQDINVLVPDPVPQDEWTNIQTSLVQSCQPMQAEIDGVFGTIQVAPAETKPSVMKRVKRLYDHAQARDAAHRPLTDGPGRGAEGYSATGNLALLLAENYGRCIDGLQEGLAGIETTLFGTAGEGAGINLGERISEVLCDERMAWLQRHAGLAPADNEFPTMSIARLRRTLLFPLGLRGSFTPLMYAGYGLSRSPVLDSFLVMERFLWGENAVRLDAHGPAVDFQAYTPERMVEVLQAARRRGMVSADGSRPLYPGETGPRVKLDLVRNYCVELREGDYIPRDPVLGPAWEDFELMNGMAAENDYFAPAAPGENIVNFRLKPAFWYQVLTRLGYLEHRPAEPPPAAGAGGGAATVVAEGAPGAGAAAALVPPVAADALAGHAAAEARRVAALAANPRIPNAMHDFAPDQPANFDLGVDYATAISVQAAHQAGLAAGTLRFNYDYLFLADPFLQRHTLDIEGLVPDPPTELQWAETKLEILGSVPEGNPAVDAGVTRDLLRAIFTEIDGSEALPVKNNIRKRIRHLWGRVMDRAAAGQPPHTQMARDQGMTLRHEFAVDFSRSGDGRCLGGISEHLEELEEQNFPDVIRPVANLGDLVSRVVADAKRDFIQKHAELLPDDPDFRVHGLDLLKQRMLLPMGLRGGLQPIPLAGFGFANHEVMAPARVMRRFLDGEANVRINVPGRITPTVTFPAFTLDALINRLQEARENGLLSQTQRVGKRSVTNVMIQRELVNDAWDPTDPALGPIFRDFVVINMQTESDAYFLANPDNAAKYHLTRDFWIYILRKYGYITS